MSRKKRDKEPRHVRLYHWMLRSEAWQSLDANARAVYIEMASRYAGPGSNNGRLPYSIREAADALKIGKSTAARAFRKLEARGFIVAMAKGKFTYKLRHSTEWRLTEFICDVTHAMPTKDFMKWSAEKKNAVPPQTRSVPVAAPFGIRSGTVPIKKAAYGI